MNRLPAVLLCVLVSIAPPAPGQDPVPADRRTDWTPGVTVGVPGGIPRRTIIGATVNAPAYGTGLVDASAAIGAAIDSCPPGQVVYIPPGTYRIDNRVYRPYASNRTIRGGGMGMTVLKSTQGSQVLLLGTADWPRPTGGIPITGSATRGSASLTVTDASTITAGHLVRVEQNDLSYVIAATAPTTNNRLMSVVCRVTGKTLTTVTISPPLPIDFPSSPTLVQYSIPPLTGTGVEDLTIDCNATSWAGIE